MTDIDVIVNTSPDDLVESGSGEMFLVQLTQVTNSVPISITQATAAVLIVESRSMLIELTHQVNIQYCFLCMQ